MQFSQRPVQHPPVNVDPANVALSGKNLDSNKVLKEDFGTVAHNAPLLMSVNVTVRLKASGDLRRREHIEIGSEIRSSIVGGCSHSMKDEEKRRAPLFFHARLPLFSPLSLSFPLFLLCRDFVSSEKRGGERVAPLEKSPVASIVHFIGEPVLVLWKRHNFPRPTSDVAHSRATHVKEETRRA